MSVSGAVRSGILINGNSGGAVVPVCYVHANSGYGIQTAGSAAPLMIGNLLYANGISRAHSSPGLLVADYSNPEVKRNIFSGNGAEAILLQRPELKDRMTDNLFVNSGKSGKAIDVVRVSGGIVTESKKRIRKEDRIFIHESLWRMTSV